MKCHCNRPFTVKGNYSKTYGNSRLMLLEIYQSLPATTIRRLHIAVICAERREGPVSAHFGRKNLRPHISRNKALRFPPYPRAITQQVTTAGPVKARGVFSIYERYW